MASLKGVCTEGLDCLKIDALFKRIEQFKLLTITPPDLLCLMNSAEELLHRQSETGVSHTAAVAIIVNEVARHLEPEFSQTNLRFQGRTFSN